MTNIEIVTNRQCLDRVYQELIEPDFPPEELISAPDFARLCANGTMSALVAEEGPALQGVAVLEYHAGNIDLLAYLAVGSAYRSEGIGTKLMTAVCAQAAGRGRRFVLAEIETPGTHHETPIFGDADRRAAFYRRFGAKAIDVRHWQPAVSPTSKPVNLKLIAIPTTSEALTSIASNQLRDFEIEYHGDPDSEVLASTLSDLSGRDDVPLFDLADQYQLR